MVQINFAQKSVTVKIVYYGPGMSGKTTNLEVVHQRAPESNKGDLTSISTDGDRTLFFDFMPLDLGTVAGMRTQFQLYTVPGQVYYNSTRKLVLQGVDGVIFIADSSASMMEENLESLRNLEENLCEYGKDIMTIPMVIQYNKRDLPDALPVEELEAKINRFGAPSFEGVASSGQGVFPTLKSLAASVLDTIHEQTGAASAGHTAPAPAAAAPAPAAAAPTMAQPAAPLPAPVAQQPRQQPVQQPAPAMAPAAELGAAQSSAPQAPAMPAPMMSMPPGGGAAPGRSARTGRAGGGAPAGPADAPRQHAGLAACLRHADGSYAASRRRAGPRARSSPGGHRSRLRPDSGGSARSRCVGPWPPRRQRSAGRAPPAPERLCSSDLGLASAGGPKVDLCDGCGRCGRCGGRHRDRRRGVQPDLRGPDANLG